MSDLERTECTNFNVIPLSSRRSEHSLPLSKSKNDTNQLLNSIQVSQSKLVDFVPEIESHYLPLKKPLDQNTCQSCLMWSNWAQESEKAMLVIQKTIIQREKKLHQRLKSLTDYFYTQEQADKKLRVYYNEQKAKDKKNIENLTLANEQLRKAQKGRSAVRPDRQYKASNNFDFCNVVKQEDDENCQETYCQTQQCFKQSHITESSGVSHQDDSKILSSLGIQNSLNCLKISATSSQSKYNQEIQPQIVSRDQSLGTVANLESFQRSHQRESTLNNDYQLQKSEDFRKDQMLPEANNSLLSKTESKDQAVNAFMAFNSVNSAQTISGVNSTSRTINGGCAANSRNNLSFVNQGNRINPSNNITPINSANLVKKRSEAPLTAAKDKNNAYQDTCKSNTDFKEKDRTSYAQTTNKTIKLNNQFGSFDRKQMGRAVTECSFIQDSGIKDQCDKTTMMSHWDERVKSQGGRNPETQKIEFQASPELVQKLNKLEFENENLKSYNRVLLQKLSNSRPRKY